MEVFDHEQVTFTEAGHLPIVKEFAKRIRLVETVNTLVDSQMELKPGLAVLAMVIDTLSGRSPLYRLVDFFEEKDTGILLGEDVVPEIFSDYNLGRVLDKIFEAGTQRIFSQLSQNAINMFALETRRVHFDTTSVRVYGDYDSSGTPFKITFGHSKDKRPDLKQFLISLLCVDRSIPIAGGTEDGNASDKTLNNELLGSIGKHMAAHGLEPGAYVYVADAAFVTERNLKEAKEKGVRFLTRLPAIYDACGQVIREAVQADSWIDIGELAQDKATKKRPHAYYHGFESTVMLYGETYRALVVHSSAHDKRRHKRIDRLVSHHRQELEDLVKKTISHPFYCLADAKVAADKLTAQAKGRYHTLAVHIEEVPRFSRGRPAKDKKRTVQRYEYNLTVKIAENPEAIAPLRQEAGCFVLLTNLDAQQEKETWQARDLLSLYKEQNGIEKNFGFLKDPVIVNSIFLKRADRIEVLGLILLISLLLWRLIEHCMRQYVDQKNETLTGWEKKPTKKPTAFMMTTKFSSVLLVKINRQRALARPFKPVQLEYLKALNVSPTVFTVP